MANFVRIVALMLLVAVTSSCDKKPFNVEEYYGVAISKENFKTISKNDYSTPKAVALSSFSAFFQKDVVATFNRYSKEAIYDLREEWSINQVPKEKIAELRQCWNQFDIDSLIICDVSEQTNSFGCVVVKIKHEYSHGGKMEREESVYVINPDTLEIIAGN